MGDSLLISDALDDCYYSQIGEEEEDDRYIHMLIQRDKPLSSLSVINEWIRGARVGAIDWMLRIRAKFGFRFQTTYLSVTYLDQYLSRRSINLENEWEIRLLSMACLSVAAKVEEHTVPPLPEFSLPEGGDVYKFESKVVQRMELLVLSTLKWNMRLVTPFAYIGYFLVKFGEDRSMGNMSNIIVQIITASMRDLNLMGYPPSVIACGATLVALDSKLTMTDLELKIGAHTPSSIDSLKVADIVSCYYRMQELHNMENVSKSDFTESPDTSLIQRSVVSRLNYKRKRLDFEDYDQSYSLSDEKRLR